MDKIINDRYSQFKEYCIQNTSWLENQKLPITYFNREKETVFIELRKLPHIYFILRNTIRVLDSSWSHTIVCGNENYDFMKEVVKKINRKIRLIKLEKDNLTRMEYSIMLLTSDFYKQFTGKYLLIYQEDTIIFKDIPNKYFFYDFVGAPLPNNKKGFNGGFSLRKKDKMIKICETVFDIKKNKFQAAKNFLEEKIEYLDSKEIDYKKNKNFAFLYKIEESLLEDLLLCENCSLLPDFNSAKEFSVEKYYTNHPIGGHQFWYSLKNVNLWLDANLKKSVYK
jgi:hypothetical protein